MPMFVQSQLKVMEAEMVARKGEVQRLQQDLTTAQNEAQQLRSEIGQLTAKASKTQKRLDAEVSLHALWPSHYVC